MKDLKAAYRTIEADHFAPKMEISFITGDRRETLRYEKVTWNIGGEEKGLRYGENPGQEAALYKLVNGNLVLGDVEMLQPGQYLASTPELLHSGKHPGKTNVTDTDNALNILRYLTDKPCAVIVKHNNPCGVALGGTLVNINDVDAEKIRAAHRDPSKYPDLIVRVTGFTAYFNSLSPAFRELVVKRLVKEAL